MSEKVLFTYDYSKDQAFIDYLDSHEKAKDETILPLLEQAKKARDLTSKIEEEVKGIVRDFGVKHWTTIRTMLQERGFDVQNHMSADDWMLNVRYNLSIDPDKKSISNVDSGERTKYMSGDAELFVSALKDLFKDVLNRKKDDSTRGELQ